MIKKICVLTVLIAGVVGCATPMSKASKAEYMKGAAPENIKSEAILKDIKRGGSDNDPKNPFSTGQVFIEAWPYTQSLIEAQARESSKKNMDSTEESQKKLAEQKKLLFDKQSCFMVGIRSREIDYAKFNNWRAKLKIDGKMDELEIMNVKGVDSVPDVDHFAGYNFLNTSVVCSKAKIDFSSAFDLILIPQYSSGSPVIMQWTKAPTQTKK